MAASVEYTEVFSYTAGAGGLTGLQYFPINGATAPADSKYVIKGLTLSSSSGIATGAGVLSAEFITATNNTGSNPEVFLTYTTGAAIGAAIPVQLINDQSTSGLYYQINATQFYLGVNVNMLAAGTFYVVINYILISGNAAAHSNFLVTSAVATANTTVAVFSAGATYTRLLKSLNLINFVNPTQSYTVQVVTLSGVTVTGYLTDPLVIDPYETVSFSYPFYLPPTSAIQLGLTITATGPGSINYYLSNIEMAQV